MGEAPSRDSGQGFTTAAIEARIEAMFAARTRSVREKWNDDRGRDGEES